MIIPESAWPSVAGLRHLVAGRAFRRGRSGARGGEVVFQAAFHPMESSHLHACRGRSRGAIAVLLAALLLAVALAPTTARACDVCAIYSATEYRDARSGLRLGVAEQFTDYGTLYVNGEETANVGDQQLLSSITQFFVSYNFTPTLSAQVTVPYIYRKYRRVEGGDQVVDGNVNGIGDMSLLGRWTAWSHVDEEMVLRFTLLGGVKFPTGSSSELEEEALEGGDEENLPAGLARPAHGAVDPNGGVPNAIGGDNLTLGSGSYDGIVGGSFFWSWNKLFLSMIGQYSIRTTGSYDYRFANSLFWFVGPGAYLITDHAYTLSLQGVVSGDTKGNDHVDGNVVEGSAETDVFCGPALGFTWESNLAAEVAVDIPFVTSASGVALVPDYRVRAALSWQF